MSIWRSFLLMSVLLLALAGCAPDDFHSTGGSTAPESAASSAAGEAAAIRSEYLGLWLRSGSGQWPASFTLMADGSCTAEGQPLRWELEKDRYAVIRILDGRTEVLRLYGYTQAGTSGELGILHRGQETTRYYSPDRYEAIQLNAENWLEYFEIVEDHSFGRDSGGNPVNFRFSREIRLKEFYAQRLSFVARSDLSLEYTALVGVAPVSFHPETGEFSIGVPASGGSRSGPYIWQAHSENGSFCQSIDGFSLETLSPAQVRLEQDYQFLRVTGVLYLLPE